LFISLPDAKLYSTSFGPKSATPILALSGWIGSWEDWAETFSILSDQWHTISYDHRGSGATIASIESITFDSLIDDVFSVLNAYKVDQCILAAASMGVAIAFGAALREPERFSGLVIVNAALSRNTAGGTDPLLLGLHKEYFQTLERYVNACIPEENSNHIKRWKQQILDRASREAAIALYRTLGSIDIRKDLNRLTQPALILHGDADTLVSLESAQWLAGALPNAKLSLLHGAGHIPTMTRPREVAGEIQGFFGERGKAQPLTTLHTTPYITAPLAAL
jgi:3-oxoadipate enol-lactonase/3-oxoadipate enol-lactonase/4-carboxymuconolactone decarboxylase